MKKLVFLLFLSTILTNNFTESIVEYITSKDFDAIYSTIEDSITRDCSFAVQQITQFNINVPFVINNPGLYCLAPNVAISPNLTGRLVLTSGTAITVNTNNVIIDFNDTILEGQGGAIGIAINSGVQNVIIRNGTIRAMTNSGISINNRTNQLNGPIFIDNMIFTNNAIGINASNPFNLIARNLRAFFSTSTGFLISQGTNCFFNACISNNNNTHGFSITNSNSLIFSGCLAEGNTTNGFNISGIAGSQFIESTANRNQNGFFVTSGNITNQSNIMDNCFAAQNNLIGFFLVANQVNLKQCTSVNNNVGFQLNGNNITFDTTIAENNNGNGIQLVGNNCQLANCQSINNSLNGFQINGNTNSIFSSIAKNNISNGFQLTGTGSEAQDCHALNNGSNGFIINGSNHSVINSIAKQNNRGSIIPTNVGNGILLALANGFGVISSNCEIRNNTVTGNSTGINNLGTNNRIYANFANNNSTNFSGVPNVAISPTILTPINFTANIAE